MFYHVKSIVCTLSWGSQIGLLKSCRWCLTKTRDFFSSNKLSSRDPFMGGRNRFVLLWLSCGVKVSPHVSASLWALPKVVSKFEKKTQTTESNWSHMKGLKCFYSSKPGLTQNQLLSSFMLASSCVCAMYVHFKTELQLEPSKGFVVRPVT